MFRKHDDPMGHEVLRAAFTIATIAVMILSIWLMSIPLCCVGIVTSIVSMVILVRPAS